MIYRIANLLIDSGDDDLAETVSRLPGFGKFQSCAKPGEDILLRLEYSSDAFGHGPANTDSFTGKKIYHIDTDEAVITLHKDSGEDFRLDVECDGRLMSMLCGPDKPEAVFSGGVTPRGLKYALWVAYGMRGLRHGRVLLHSSAIACEGKAHLFLGESGTGKSTHTRLWARHIAGSSLLNDDSPALACEGDKILVYGSPWSGKTDCYRTEAFPLGSLTRLHQSPRNEIARLGVARAYAALHPSLPPLFCYDPRLSEYLETIEDKVISNIQVCAMGCLPDEEAARMAHDFLTGQYPRRP